MRRRTLTIADHCDFTQPTVAIFRLAGCGCGFGTGLGTGTTSSIGAGR